MSKIVIGTKTNSTFNVEQGKKCKVLKSFFYNGETWYKLEDITTSDKFESPAIFWEDYVKSNHTKGLIFILVNCNNKQITLEYDSPKDFVNLINSDNIDIPMLDDTVIEMYYYGRYVPKKDFDTVQSVYDYCSSRNCENR